MRIAAVRHAFPPHYYDQAELIAAFRRAWGRRHYNLDRLEQLHRNVLVGGRHLALPLEEYDRLETWGQANDAWIRVGEEVGAEAVRQALAAAGLDAGDVDVIVFVSVTGISTPSLDARLVNRLNLPAHVRRVPIFGLGCVAGAAGLSRAADLLRGSGGQVAVLLSVELCSLTLQREDLSVPNLIATGLFGDGAAAAVVAADDAPQCHGPRIVATRSVFYPGSEHVMGWSISESGFRVVLSPDVPAVVLGKLGGDVDSFLRDQGLTRGDIRAWISHPGGPKVLEAMQQALGLDAAALEASWRSLREAGNLSSASILLVLEDVMRDAAPPPGGHGLMIAMGPGFCSELVLLRW
ncbi:MAG TPA: 3-oxoacyl-[acyl-carrier-protein] synthase III C-terminal domain-containing protein [Vicinamibacterales bacterium]|nr:3-oxoacyl-[acyl-carrier-protein] synthase III C-terminal domain-containing protein [Vicinamibacterales bacterium]